MTKYDLEERTTVFAENIIELCSKINKTIINQNMVVQLIKSATSVGANHCEADTAESKKDFIHKIGICKKEAKESRYWLRLLYKGAPGVVNETKILWQEAHELQLIFIAIVKKSKD